MAQRVADLQAAVSIFANGAVSISASAGADAVIASRDGFVAGDGLTNTFYYNYPKNISNTKLAEVIAAGATLQHDPKATWLFDTTLSRRPAGAAVAPEDIAKVMPASLESFAKSQKDALILAVALKANWWRIGHHTGMGTLVGYAAKCAQVLGLSINTPEEIAAVWRLGHWFDTRRILFAVGVQGLQENNANGVPVPLAPPRGWVNPLQMGPEVAKRISSNPAGTAKLCDVLAGIEAVKVIPAVNLVESVNLAAYKSWLAAAADIAARPANYHIGSKYLTGSDPLPIPQIPEFVYVWIKSVLEATGASATLLDAQCFKAVGVNPGLIKSIKAATENSTSVRPDSINTLAVYVDGAAPAKIAAAQVAK